MNRLIIFALLYSFFFVSCCVVLVVAENGNAGHKPTSAGTGGTSHALTDDTQAANSLLGSTGMTSTRSRSNGSRKPATTS